jgi:hypothetical protein
LDYNDIVMVRRKIKQRDEKQDLRMKISAKNKGHHKGN